MCLLDGQLAQRPFAHSQSQRVGGGLQQRRVVGPGQQRLAPALDVQRERPIDEHHQRTGLATRLVPLTGRPNLDSPSSANLPRHERTVTGVTPTVAAILELGTPSAAINSTLARCT